MTTTQANSTTMHTGLGGRIGSAVVRRGYLPGNMQPGGVLVAIETTPDLYEDMVLADAVVTCRGGRMSHAAIVCLEMNKPFVVGVKTLTEIVSRMKAGEEFDFRVEPHSGVVEVMEVK